MTNAPGDRWVADDAYEAYSEVLHDGLVGEPV